MFVDYCNERMVVLIGHDPRADEIETDADGTERTVRPITSLPIAPDGTSVIHPGLKLADMLLVFQEWPLYFAISPGVYCISPHGIDPRSMPVEKPERNVIVPEAEFMGHKSGSGNEFYINLFQKAQKMLGEGQSRTDYLAGKPGPQTIWQQPKE